MHQCIVNDDTSFIPVNNAIVLKEHREREEAESRELSDKVGRHGGGVAGSDDGWLLVQGSGVSKLPSLTLLPTRNSPEDSARAASRSDTPCT